MGVAIRDLPAGCDRKVHWRAENGFVRDVRNLLIPFRLFAVIASFDVLARGSRSAAPKWPFLDWTIN